MNGDDDGSLDRCILANALSPMLKESGRESPAGHSNRFEGRDTDTDDEEGLEIDVSNRRFLLASFHLDGDKSDSD